MIEGSRSLIAQQPGDLCDRNAGLLDVFERQALPQTIGDLFVACVLFTELLRERSLSQPQRLGEPIRPPRYPLPTCALLGGSKTTVTRRFPQLGHMRPLACARVQAPPTSVLAGSSSGLARTSKRPITQFVNKALASAPASKRRARRSNARRLNDLRVFFLRT